MVCNRDARSRRYGKQRLSEPDLELKMGKTAGNEIKKPKKSLGRRRKTQSIGRKKSNIPFIQPKNKEQPHINLVTCNLKKDKLQLFLPFFHNLSKHEAQLYIKT